GGLIRGARRKAKQRSDKSDRSASGARYGLFVAPRDGMASFVEAIAARLSPVSIGLNATVTKIERSPTGHWELVVTDQRGQHSEDFDALIVATPAYVAGKLLAGAD